MFSLAISRNTTFTSFLTISRQRFERLTVGTIACTIMTACGLSAENDVTVISTVAGERYLVEGDLLLSQEALQLYSEGILFSSPDDSITEKSLVMTVESGRSRVDAVRSKPMDLRYCLTNGWGGPEAAKQNVLETLARAADAWEGVAGVRFRHVKEVDGAGCHQEIVGTTVDFTVKPNVGNPNTSFAWMAFAQVQELGVGGQLGSNLPIMTHELGHILGLDHEQFHPDSKLGCEATNYKAPRTPLQWGDRRTLTDYDDESIMHYYEAGDPSCGGGSKKNLRISRLDGLGVRSLYGNPDWWAAVLPSIVLH